MNRWSSLSADWLKAKFDDFFIRADERGLFGNRPTFDQDYAHDYPELARLESHYGVIRRECEALLRVHDRLVNVSELGGERTAGGIHVVRWKSFMFKSGEFVDENCRLAPRTAELLRTIPGLYTAFFSILEGNQYIEPHWGYWKGFLRYHLGVIIPSNNADGACWLRVNSSADANRAHDIARIAEGEKYFWRNGKSVMFDDTHLHDAMNGSNELRVVLWLDVRRKMPMYLQVINRVFLAIAFRLPMVARVRKNSVTRL
jgi:aspartyl/asparaginyl beta-hydroxylase (cupin superfamily)